MSAVSWTEVARPQGRQPIPDWCKSLHIDWGYGHAGWPDVKLKCYEDIGDWPGRAWREEQRGMYVARSDDGRVECHYHEGAVRELVAWTVYRGDQKVTFEWHVADPLPGETPEQAARREGEKHLALCHRLDKDQVSELRFKPVLATTQQNGYAGRNFTISLEGGRELILRGPWHGSPPAGTVEVTITRLSEYGPRWHWRHGHKVPCEPWHRAMGMFGVSITEDLYLRLLARFAPEVPVARVEWLPGRFHLEPYRAEWGMPKSFIYEQERLNTGEPGPFAAVYWGNRTPTRREPAPDCEVAS